MSDIMKRSAFLEYENAIDNIKDAVFVLLNNSKKSLFDLDDDELEEINFHLENEDIDEAIHSLINALYMLKQCSLKRKWAE